MGTLYGANLTRGRGGIAAAYTDADWVRALLHGVRRDSRSVVFMPSHDFHFTEQDTADLIAFFRALPPIDRNIPGPRVGMMARALSFGPLPLLPAELIDHERVAFARPPQSTDRVVVGRHLVDTGGCRGCHQPDLAGGGGPPPGGANITPTGIGDWSDDDFLKAIRSRVRPNGTPIAESNARRLRADDGRRAEGDPRASADRPRTGQEDEITRRTGRMIGVNLAPHLVSSLWLDRQISRPLLLELFPASS
jgi:mono/diheme cytochrome c family protein